MAVPIVARAKKPAQRTPTASYDDETAVRSLYLKTRGLTDLRLANAPFLNLMMQDLLVVHPSGKM